MIKSILIGIDLNNTITGKTKNILAMLDPTTFPSTISPSDLMLAITLTTSSGKLVPKAIIVNPMTTGEIRRVRAIKVELSIKSVDQKKIPKEPNMK